MAVTDWGQRCCAKDIAELRQALTLIQASSRYFQAPVVLGSLNRRSTVLQLGAIVGQLNGALNAFANTGDAQSAAAALDTVARQVEALARVVAGTQLSRSPWTRRRALTGKDATYKERPQ